MKRYNKYKDVARPGRPRKTEVDLVNLRCGKGFFALLLCFTLCLGGAGAAEGRDLTQQKELAGRLQSLGLFLGVGEDESGAADFALDRPLTREEAVTMLVRALGKGAEAAGMEKTHPFVDVPAWADGYVSYAWETGLTKGTSDTTFGAGETATGEMYVTFLLRALGYPEGESGWLDWSSPWALAAWCGILPTAVERTDFLRADAVTVTAAALFARPYRSEDILAGRLIDQGAFTQVAFEKAFPADPFQEEKEISEAILAFLEEEGYVGAKPSPLNTYGSACWILDAVQETEGGLEAYALMCFTGGEVQRDGTLSAKSSSWMVRRFTLESSAPAAGEDQARLTVTGAVAPDDQELSARLRAERDKFMEGMRRVADAQLLDQLERGIISYRQPTYEETMAEIAADDFYQEEQRWESDYGTVMLGNAEGTPHPAGWSLRLVTKPAHAQGEGLVIQLPIVRTGTFSDARPDQVSLSEDGRTLIYSFHFDHADVEGQGTPSEYVFHEAGTYTYTVDLSTGEAAETFAPPEGENGG